MASSVTITEKTWAPVKRIKFDWTAHTDGVVTGVATTLAYTGKVVALTTDPDAGTAPTDNYDITITDSDGIDVLLGAGANRDTANVEQVASASLGIVVGSTLTFAASGAGSGGKGVAWLDIQ